MKSSHSSRARCGTDILLATPLCAGPPPQAVTRKPKAATARTATRSVVALVTFLVSRSCGQPETVQDRCASGRHTCLGG